MDFFFIAYVAFVNVLVQHVQTMHCCVLAHVLSCSKALHQVGAASWVTKEVMSSSELHLFSHSQGLLLPWTGQTRQSKPGNPFSLESRGGLQQVISRMGGRQAGLPSTEAGWPLALCPWPAGTIRLAVAKRQHMPTWLEREPAKTTGLQDGMAHTRNTNSWHPFAELPTGSLAWWELVLIREAFLWAAATLPILPSPAS